MRHQGTPLTYQSSGVDVNAAHRAMDLAKGAIASTYQQSFALPSGFFTGGMFLPKSVRKMRNPILVANSDGIGTLTHEAINSRRYMELMGYSLANHNFMDLVASGAVPSGFLDTIDYQKIDPLMHAMAIKGMVRSCKEVGAVLLGGETASLPVLVQPGQVIMNGTAIGFVDEREVIDGTKRIRPGDVIIGLQSPGLLINGLSLARRAIFERAGLGLNDFVPGIKRTVLHEMTRGMPNYAKYLLPVVAGYRKIIHGIFNVTGDGIPGNLVRILPKGVRAIISKSCLPKLPIFSLIAQHVEAEEMWNTFNLGIGVGFVTTPRFAELLISVLKEAFPKTLAPINIGYLQKIGTSEPEVYLQ